jgi:hypothetical protein
MTRIARGSAQLPPLTSVAAALRATTERLAGELASPREAPPEWSPFEWRTARAAAAIHGISGLLAGALLWRGPEGWADFLGRQREHTARHQLRTLELLDMVDERFRRQGIPVQALKGAVLCREGLYQRGQRPMADLDLLTTPEHTVRAGEILEHLGLRETSRSLKNREFEARESTRVCSFGEHADAALKVDLHERICEPLPHRLTDISSLVSSPAPVPGLNPHPSPAALMAHLLLHAAGGMAHRTLRLVQLHDIVLLTRRLTVRDWQQLVDWRPWWAAPPLLLTERYYGTVIPEAVMASIRRLCPTVLRRTCMRQRLSDTSLSHLWLEAFPGIEWSRTAGEAMLFMVRRVVPGAQVRSDRKFAHKTNPALAQGDWGSLSQSRRILRAVRTRTPRPWPLHIVRAALAEPR